MLCFCINKCELCDSENQYKMRRRILVTILMAVLAASTVSCDKYALKSEVDELENRVSKLETLCQQMNSNISALQTIVQALEGQD